MWNPSFQKMKSGRSADAPFEILRLYLEAGGQADKCVMSHLDRKYHIIQYLLTLFQPSTLNCSAETPTPFFRNIQDFRFLIIKHFFYLKGTIRETSRLLEFAEAGAYCQFDLFGTECSFYQLNIEFDMPSDAQRMDHIVRLVHEGYEDKILISHDIHTKHRLVRS